jgi:hypothetical protein
MKKFLFLTLLGFIAFSLNAQHVFNNNDKMFNAGIGLLSSDGPIPSINGSFEIGAIPTGDAGLISFGGITAFQLGSYYLTGYTDTYFVFHVGPRATWHLHVFESDKWDAYAGIGFGLRFRSGYDDYWGYHYDGYVGGYGEGFVGGRMMLKENFGLFAEMGYGTLSAFKFGITMGL